MRNAVHPPTVRAIGRICLTRNTAMIYQQPAEAGMMRMGITGTRYLAETKNGRIARKEVRTIAMSRIETLNLAEASLSF